MGNLGGFGMLPIRLGGGETDVESIYRSLNESKGSAYDTSDASNVTAETMAEARAIAAVYRSNARMSYQWDAKRMYDFIPRWEKIFNIHPGPTASVPSRRAALGVKFLALVGHASLSDTVQAIIGDCFVSIVYTSLDEAYMRWPGNGYPNDFLSNTAHILIKVQFSANQTQAEFWDLMARMSQQLRDQLPVWTTFDWGMDAEAGGEGFYLDDPIAGGPPPTNLNYELLDE